MRVWIVLTLFCFALALPPPGLALDKTQSGALAVENKNRAVEIALSHVSGRVLRVDKTKTTYRVKVLTQSGRVVMLKIDSKTGQIKQKSISKES